MTMTLAEITQVKDAIVDAKRLLQGLRDSIVETNSDIGPKGKPVEGTMEAEPKADVAELNRVIASCTRAVTLLGKLKVVIAR